ncbi:MAG: uracil-DNA glycosylase [Acidobacteriota bacterium]
MPTETDNAEFLALVKDVREQVAYFKEIGVQGAEKISPNSEAKTVPSLKSERPATASVPAPSSDGSALRLTAFGDVPATPDAASLFGDLSAPPVKIKKSAETFEDIWADIGDCTRCPLYQGRTNIVHTDGNRKARLMFVGEAPGADEDAQARPFVGRAGQLLTKIIEAIGLKREEVLIGNVNRCRPPANRPPTPEEAGMCKPFLLREIGAVQPEVIVVLGNTAMKNLLDTRQGITKARGEFQDYQGVKVMPTFHPAYLLRDPSKKKETWEDLKKVRDYLDRTRKPEN